MYLQKVLYYKYIYIFKNKILVLYFNYVSNMMTRFPLHDIWQAFKSNSWSTIHWMYIKCDFWLINI